MRDVLLLLAPLCEHIVLTVGWYDVGGVVRLSGQVHGADVVASSAPMGRARVVELRAELGRLAASLGVNLFELEERCEGEASRSA